MGFTVEDAGTFSRQMPNSGSDSFWFPAHNPLIPTVRRVDDTISTSNNGGFTQIQTFSTSGVVTVGSLVFINTVYGGGAIEDVYTVTSIVDPNNFVIDFAYNGVNENGYLNYNSDRPNYYFILRLMKYDDSDNLVVIATQNHVPFSNGIAYPDISGMVRKTVNTDDDYKYDIENEADRNLSSRLVLDFSEFYGGVHQAFDPTWTLNIFGVNAALQIDSREGANMLEYVTEPSGQDLAKFLTKFERPTAWAGLPYDVQFIFSDLLEQEINASPPDITFLRTRELFVPNDGIVTAFTENLDLTQYFYVNRIRLRSACAPTSSSLVARHLEFQLRLTDGAAAVRVISETKIIKMVQAIPCNPVYLKWWNTNGGWDYWCFSFAQDDNLNVQGGEQFSKFFLPSATGFPIIAREERNFLTKKATPSLIIGADGLDEYDKAGLKNLLYSPKVMMLQNIDDWDTESSPTNDPKWLTVYVEPGTFKFGKTNETRFNLQFVLQLTEIEIQSQ